MATGKFVSYIRVSTARQGASGLGLEAQQEAVQRFLNGGSWELLGEFKEVETGKGADALAKRPQLGAALDACRKHGATLVIAKLDRLARNVHFVSGLMESKVRFVACDMPEANELTIHIMAAFAEHEAKRISQRTKDALAVAKARGAVLGKSGAANLRPNLEARQQAANAFAARSADVRRHEATPAYAASNGGRVECCRCSCTKGRSMAHRPSAACPRSNRGGNPSSVNAA